MDREKLMRRIYKRHQDVNIDDLLQYIKLYMEIRELEEEYLVDYQNRKSISMKIEEKKKDIKLLSEVFEYTLNTNSPTPFQDAITDIELALSTILTLANQDGYQYTIRKFYTAGFTFQETKHGKRERSIAKGSIYMIGRYRDLDRINASKSFFDNEFSAITTEMINNGKSFILFTDYYYDRSVKPITSTYDKNDLDIIDFAVEGTFNKLSCYLFETDDDLLDVVKKFQKYIELSGGDIKGIPLGELRENILNANEEKKEKVKKISQSKKQKEELKNYDGVVFYYE